MPGHGEKEKQKKKGNPKLFVAPLEATNKAGPRLIP
jgi:hypothetical protein